jgi:hypothetical protein
MKCALPLAALLMSLPAGAQDQGIWITGVNCGDWVQQRTARASDGEWYLVGLIDGIALGTHTEIWRAGGIRITGEQVFLWMDKYCRENPLSTVITGAFRLHEEQVRKN